MALAQVRDFVRHDGGEFVFGLSILEQTTVHTDDTPGHGEGVDGGVVDDHQLNPTVLQLTVLCQLEDQVFKVAVQKRVVHQGSLTPKASQPHASQLVLVICRKQTGARFAQIRDLEVLGDGPERGREARGNKPTGAT